MMIWYVAYSPLPAPKSRAGAGERLEQFADEEAAKEFAKKKAADDPKLRIRAGTLPGFIPAKQIDPAQIHRWLEPSKKTHG